MSQQPESRLVNKILVQLKGQYGGFWVKVHGGPYQRVGLPDIIGCVHGRFIGLEVKLPGKEKTLTEIQKATLKQLRDAGGAAEMVTSVEQAEGAVNRALWREI